MKKILLSAILATAPVAAQLTGDWGKATQMRGMMGGGGVWGLIGGALFIGLTVLVWLYVIKTWKELHRRK